MSVAGQLRSGRAAFVPMVEAADLGKSDNRTVFGSHDGARNRRIFVQREMRSGAFVIVDVGVDNSAQPAFAEDDDVVSPR